VCASLNRFNTMREWLPIPSAASAITLRQAARNATGLYNCFLTRFYGFAFSRSSSLSHSTLYQATVGRECKRRVFSCARP